MNETMPASGNTEHHEPPKKRRVSILQILIILTILNVLAWGAIQVVEHGPRMVAWLGDKVESVRDGQLTVLPNNDTPADIRFADNATTLQTTEATTLAWDTDDSVDTYYLTYSCIDGVSMSHTSGDTTADITCETPYNLGKQNQATVAIKSDNEQFVDVLYTITGTKSNSIVSVGASTITIENPDATTLFADNDTPNEPVITEPTPETPATNPEPTPTVAGTSDTTVTTRPTPRPLVYEYIPVSNPNGTVDLAVRFFSTGTLLNGTYFKQDIVRNHSGAMQFEVRNMGTKTSGTWTYQVALPNGGVYNSPAQAALKPNERALLTISFPTPDASSAAISVTASIAGDSAPLNNSFTRTVSFVR